MTSSLSYVIATLPQPLWLDFLTQYQGTRVLDEHETILRELTSLSEIASELHSVELRFLRLRLYSLSKDFPALTTASGELDDEAVTACLQREIEVCEELVETVRSVILAPIAEARETVNRLNPPPPRQKTARRSPRTVLMSFRPEQRFVYTALCTGREKLERELQRRWQSGI